MTVREWLDNKILKAKDALDSLSDMRGKLSDKTLSQNVEDCPWLRAEDEPPKPAEEPAIPQRVYLCQRPYVRGTFPWPWHEDTLRWLDYDRWRPYGTMICGNLGGGVTC